MTTDELGKAARGLAARAIGSHCAPFGAEVAVEGDWRDGDDRLVTLSDGSRLRLVHDEREAPYSPADPDLLVSLTDEDGLSVCVWGVPCAGAGVAGLGIDLASTADFAGERGAAYNRLLFSAHERDFVQKHYAEAPEVGFALAFSAKEAAFKACAAPLRTWDESHARELVFEVREFELADAAHARGTLRHARAQDAMDAMGICAIELLHAELDGAVLTIALAMARA